jgi:D-alanyl-D-alanine dipeptidase
MEAAYDFMQRLLEYPVEECGESLESLREAALEAGVEIVFAPGRKLGMFDRVFDVRRSLVEKLLRIAEACLRRDCLLRIEDAYRSPATQARGACSAYVIESVLRKVLWELDGAPPTAELVFRRLAVWTATTLKFANHTSGSAVDVTVAGRDGTPLDLGGAYPQLSHQTPMASPFISSQAGRNRQLLCEVFAEEGFVPYPFEFWHFSHGDADCEMIAATGRPGRFGPVEWSGDTRQITPVHDSLRPLVTIDEILPYLPEQRRP